METLEQIMARIKLDREERKRDIWEVNCLKETGYYGVFRNLKGKPFRTEILIGSRRLRIGNFNTDEEAAETYNRVAPCINPKVRLNILL